jgi:glycosyltransferase involved in cell wall biosynthesis
MSALITGSAPPPRIGLIAYACDPDQGTEPGKSWNWAKHLALAGFDVDLITRDRTDANQRTVERFRRLGAPGTLSVHPVPDPPTGSRLGRLVPPAMRDEWVLLDRYLGWLRNVQDVADRGGLDSSTLLHHVSYATLNSGSVITPNGKPVVFGPVGGGQRTSVRLYPLLGRSAYAEVFRGLYWGHKLRFDAHARRSIRRAAVVLATNRETSAAARAVGARRAELMLSNPIEARYLISPEKIVRELDRPVVLWVGSLRPRKAPELALHAFSVVRRQLPAARLRMVGTGPLEEKVRALAVRLGLADAVDHVGRIPFAAVQQEYRRAAVLLFTSVRDSFGAQTLEAWASGLPTVSFAHQGVGDFAPAGGAITLRDLTAGTAAERFGQAVLSIVRNPDRHEDMCIAARRGAEKYTWEAHVRRMSEIYAAVLR